MYWSLTLALLPAHRPPGNALRNSIQFCRRVLNVRTDPFWPPALLLIAQKFGSPSPTYLSKLISTQRHYPQLTSFRHALR